MRRLLPLLLLLALAAWPVATRAADEGPSTVAFATDAMTVNRSDGDPLLDVVRTGDTGPAVTATITSSEGYSARFTVPAGTAGTAVRVPLETDIAPGGYVTYELSAPSAGAIGEPSQLQMMIYDDVVEPQPNRAPDTSITRTRRTSIAGDAGDPEDRLAGIAVAVLKRERGKCRVLKASGRIGKRGACRSAYRLRAPAAMRWTLKLPHRLPRGRYLVRARAIDAEGLVDASPARRSFTVR